MYPEIKDDEQVTISDLINKMKECLKDTDIEPHNFPHMKYVLKSYFENRNVISQIDGKQNTVTLKTTASKFWTCDEKNNIIEAAAKFTKQDIRDISQTKETYRSVEDLSTDTAMRFLPPSLLLLLKTLFCGKDSRKQIASISQAFMQATRHSLRMAPLLIGLGDFPAHIVKWKRLKGVLL